MTVNPRKVGNPTAQGFGSMPTRARRRASRGAARVWDWDVSRRPHVGVKSPFGIAHRADLIQLLQVRVADEFLRMLAEIFIGELAAGRQRVQLAHALDRPTPIARVVLAALPAGVEREVE